MYWKAPHLQRLVAEVHESIAAPRAIDDALLDWRRILGFALGPVVLLSAAFAVALSVGAARR